jgi:hypothetical protein
MPRIRTVKPEFWHDEKVAPLPAVDRLVFLGLIGMADDAGRVLDNVKVIDAFIFAFRPESSAKSVSRLAALGRIERGLTASGQSVIQITNWPTHQRVDHPNMLAALPPIVGPKHPIPEAVAKPSRTARDSIYDLRPTTNDHNVRFEEAWKLYPKRPGNSKQAALRAWVAQVKKGADPDAMLEGARRYAARVRKDGTEPKFVKLAATFWGPDRHWEAEPESPVKREKGPRRPERRSEGSEYPPPLSEGLESVLGRLGIPRSADQNVTENPTLGA